MINQFTNIIKKVCHQQGAEQFIPLHEPDFSGTQAWEYVKDCLDTGWVSSAGKWVSRFEEEICKYTGCKDAVAVANGTVAIRLALHVIGVEPGDEVLMPSMSFVATANAASHLGAIPHFVDIEEESLGMCPKALQKQLEKVGKQEGSRVINRVTGRRISAIVPVHIFGHPANLPAIKNIADTWGIPVVEDAAEALGSWNKSIHCGLFGKMGCISFNGNKLITTGGGGALITNDHELATKARHLSTTAKKPHQWEFEHDAIGWNDRMPNLNAALGVAQLEDLKRRLIVKRKLAEQYQSELQACEDIAFVTEPSGCHSNYWLVSVRITKEDTNEAKKIRDKILEACHDHKLQLRPIWKPMHQLMMYKDAPQGDLSKTNDQANRLLNLPSSPQLTVFWEK